MFHNIKEIIANIVKSRLFILSIIFCLMFAVLINRIFQLQIIKGNTYLENFTLTIKKERTIPSTRGKIYDANGELLAYNELAYAVTIEDNGTYASTAQKNEKLNDVIHQLIQIVETNGDDMNNDFNIVLDGAGNFSYTVSDAQLLRFLGDIYGEADVEKLTEEEKNATPLDVINYLRSDKKYDIADIYTDEEALKIITVRYALAANSYQKYLAVTVASDVSDKTVAVVKENSDKLQGVNIEEGSVRKYVDSEYFSHIIGYTGKISQEELTSLTESGEKYELTDVVGKSGIEKYMETDLQGENGTEGVYVDNLGKVVETDYRTEPVAGNDVHLTIEKDLQEAIYNIIEQKLAGVLVSRIQNIKEYVPAANATASDIVIPIDDVYFALLDNNVIDINHFSASDAKETESAVYAKYEAKKASVIANIADQLTGSVSTPYQNLSDEMKVYVTFLVTYLSDNGVIIKDAVDTEDEIYKAWKNETISLREYLAYAVSQNWIDITKINVESQYADSAEIFQSLVSYIEISLTNNTEFDKKLYKYMIKENTLSGQEICLMLYEQGKLAETEGVTPSEAIFGAGGAYKFIVEKIKSLEITPAQLALWPNSGSCVVTDVNTGNVLALVTYPSYDNNKFANSIDADYYNQLLNDKSYPLLNRATQQKTAPGSTFKMVSATAGLEEGVITPSEQIQDLGEFDKVEMPPKCWIFTASHTTHGKINVSEALRDSCNYFFYEVGWRLGTTASGQYSNQLGLDKLKKYATMYGLGETSGVEITESTPQITNEDAVRSAIGQGTNNFTNVQLSRYVTTIANSGTAYNLTLLDKLTDSGGNVIEDYEPTVYNTLDDVESSTWTSIHEGMRMVVENLSAFKNIDFPVAGKTGTAQEVTTKPNHALFVSYAPYDNPEIAITVQIANGYASSNAAEVGRDVVKYYFNLADESEIITGRAAEPDSFIAGD
ncbi:penicillin-binding transpeptidase domain-containing protein [Konateibacter massiliensis]|uniref:penicillin-binding transpeptidase domain-containing protein n=1 Tax=Konateibacter massiliensis TaxID=2002841 RepID=UPI000C14C30B|nr:penicillin-binding transpeptidase domain-containing protein [Konateibacter massiliensis]